MNTPMLAHRRFFTAHWLIGIVLGCLALIALGLALSGAPREQPALDPPQRMDVSGAFQIYRANEWRAEEPLPTRPSGWAQYRAGEHTGLSAEPRPSGWAQYRAGEHTGLSAEPRPSGWAQYRAGERALR